MISTERYRSIMILFTKCLQWFESLLESEAPEGMNSADEAIIDVNRNADRDRAKDAVYRTGSKPHRVCARFL